MKHEEHGTAVWILAPCNNHIRANDTNISLRLTKPRLVDKENVMKYTFITCLHQVILYSSILIYWKKVGDHKTNSIAR